MEFNTLAGNVDLFDRRFDDDEAIHLHNDHRPAARYLDSLLGPSAQVHEPIDSANHQAAT